MSRIPCLAGAAALALALLAPTAAHADRWTGTEAAGDVRAWNFEPEPAPCGTDTQVDGIAETHTDLTAVTVRHTRRAMVVTSRFRDLDADLPTILFVNVRSSTGGWWLDLWRDQTRTGTWRTTTFLGGEPEFPDPDEIGPCGEYGLGIAGIGCRIKRDLDFEADHIRLTVPRRCMDNPRWVRVAASNQRSEDSGTEDDPSSNFFIDDLDGGTVLSEWMPPFGPRVPATSGAPTGAARTDTSSSQERHFVVGRDGIFARR
jgi:hypothetical protein